MRKRPGIDQKDYETAIFERKRNVVIDAGAGTGKTTAIVDRVIELVAPSDEKIEGYSITRIAAITFTRKAAGELRFRIRQALLQEVAKGASGKRTRELHAALSHLDMAPIGTVHSFCDRLMRLRSVEMKLSPSYQIVQDISGLLSETLDILIRASQEGKLADFAGDSKETLEAEKALVLAIDSGISLDTWEGTGYEVPGLDSLIKGWINQRDVEVEPPEVVTPDPAETHSLAKDILAHISALNGNSVGYKLFADIRGRLEELLRLEDPTKILRGVIEILQVKPPGGGNLQKARDCDGDDALYRLAKDYGFSPKDKKSPDVSYRDQLALPWTKWLAAQLVRSIPVVLRVYESIKKKNESADQIDLLLRFRDVLRENMEIRRFYQDRFDQILVDEFQDTDPLQMEILLYLTEAADSEAGEWKDVKLEPGRLTIVGDPKQSIYRFRRADIRTYEEARSIILSQGAIEARLTANFRSVPELIEVFNKRFVDILGDHPEGTPSVDTETGCAFYDPLSPSGTVTRMGGPPVRGLPYQDMGRKGENLGVEAELLARRIRSWVESGELTVRDAETNESRPVHYEDFAILARATGYVPNLLEAFRTYGVPYTARGGRLFLKEPVVRTFLLALRAIAEKEDGPAQAILHRPPFFPVDYEDLLAGRCGDDAIEKAVAGEKAGRGREAEELIAELRKERNLRRPSETGFRLLEETACARTLSLSPNGLETLSVLREVLLEMDTISSEREMDFDGVTEVMRGWIDKPADLNPPDPIDSSSVRVMTIHQAKGLEFPVVVFWDGLDGLANSGWTAGAWHADRLGNAWSLDVSPVKLLQPENTSLLDDEKGFSSEERKRLFYVAATRARDFLVLPLPEAKAAKVKSATHIIADKLEAGEIKFDPPYAPDSPPSWAMKVPPLPSSTNFAVDKDLDRTISNERKKWEECRNEAGRGEAVPVNVTDIAKAKSGEEKWDDRFRFGPAFGTVVHEVLEALLLGGQAPVEEYVRISAERIGLEEHHQEAADDIERALEALRKAGILEGDYELYPEYPVAMVDGESRLVSGTIDLVAMSGDKVWILDFKTDEPPGEGESVPETYRRQLGIYKELLSAGAELSTREISARLLFTKSGAFHEIHGAQRSSG